MRRRIVAGLLFGSILFSACANSELLEVDLDSPGDRHLSLDTTTGFEWLDLSQTLNYSINDVLANRGDWWSRGFRYATYDQVSHLYDEAGLVKDVFTTPSAPGLAFQALVGMSWVAPPTGPSGGGGIYASAWLAPFDPDSDDQYERMYQGGAVVVRPAQDDYYAVVAWTSASDQDQATDRHAHWLVRPAIVPVPGAAWLLGSALGVLGVMRRPRAT